MKMKQMTKQVLTGVLAFVILIAMIPMQKVAASTGKNIQVNVTQTVALKSGKTTAYTFSAPEDGYFYVEFKTTKIGSKNMQPPTLSIYDQSGEMILRSVEATTKGQLYASTLYATKGGKKFNVQLASQKGDSTIEFKVVYVSTKNWENEGNDSEKTACKLTNKKYKYGTVTYSDGADFFKFKINKTSKVKITFGPKSYMKENHYWDVLLYNTSNEVIELIGNARDVESQTVYLTKGTYYLRVRYEHNAEDIPYKIKYEATDYSVSIPQITKVTLNKNTSGCYLEKISLKSSGKMDGYTVQVAKKKSMSGKYINKDMYKREWSNYVTSKYINFSEFADDYNLSNKKATYYVRVRGFVMDPFGHEIYGKFSEIKSATK